MLVLLRVLVSVHECARPLPVGFDVCLLWLRAVVWRVVAGVAPF